MKTRLWIALGMIAAVVAVIAARRRGQRAPDEPGAPEGVVSARPLDELTRDELYEEARRLDVPGRSTMKKAELRHAVGAAAAVQRNGR
ncbi:MAG TPA: Rho termination factor N-terminal domain-containing protein [Thermoleophilaceae bacterium]|nr:Rho termination factor N-terminal domain-containing protein [Thermoleophilaceae bacterium]